MTLSRKTAVIFRVGYGARNAVGPLASSLEAWDPNIKIEVVEGDPRPLAARMRSLGYKPVVLYGVSTPLFLEIAREIAEVARVYPTAAGGPHATGAYWQLLRLGVKAAVIGDGEAAVPLLVEALAGKRDYSEVPNIAYLEGERFRTTRRIYIELDRYAPHSPRHGLYPPIEIMRGCTHRCTFCEVPYQAGGKVRFRSIGSIVEAVKDYVSAGKKNIRFIAPVGLAYMSRDMKTPNPDAVEKMLLSVRRVGGKPYLGSFPSETRPEFVTEEVVRVIARLAENKRISVGLQSGSDKMLRLHRRGHDYSEVKRAVEVMLKYGLTPVVDIIFGLPGEDEEDVEATINAMKELASMGARLRLHTFLPLPGTPLARSKPGRVHRKYRDTVKKLLGRGVVEGYWREQESLAKSIHCIMSVDPLPTPQPKPLPHAMDACREEQGMGLKTAILLLGSRPETGGTL